MYLESANFIDGHNSLYLKRKSHIDDKIYTTTGLNETAIERYTKEGLVVIVKMKYHIKC